MSTLPQNTFFDINKFPAAEGMLVFPISMSRISNESQNAKRYWEYLGHINPSKINKNSPNSKVGAIFIYGDYLYLYSDEKSNILKRRYMDLVASHKNSFGNLLKGDPYLIHDSISYKVWNQFYLDCDKFVSYLDSLKRTYEGDRKFQEYIRHDLERLNSPERSLDENQLYFFLEEHLMLYLIAKGQMRLENNFVDGREKWILVAYPGKPLKAHVYIHQQNFFNLENPQNVYQNSWYDLEGKKLYDFDRIDLETFDR